MITKTIPGHLQLHLSDETATLTLGADLAHAMTSLALFPAILLYGELGAGKTTLTRGLVEALPGGSLAEVASPSFNYMNSYPTQPETSHFDLYRLRHQGMDDELLDAMHDATTLVIVEWAEFCPERQLPRNSLAVQFTPDSTGRQVSIAATGEDACRVLTHVRTVRDAPGRQHEAEQGV